MNAQTFKDSDTVDFVIVGSGAAGGVIARELAQGGLTVVVLEQGPRFSLRSFRHDELKDWYLGGITNDAVKNPQTFRSDATKKAELQKLKPPPIRATTIIAARAAADIPSNSRHQLAQNAKRPASARREVSAVGVEHLPDHVA